MDPRLVTRAGLERSALAARSDQRLTELTHSGSEAAFELLVARHRRDLVTLCARIVGDADAEEAVQEALLRAHRALVRGDPVTNASAWLRAIAHNAALSQLRERGNRAPPVAAARTECAGAEDKTVQQRIELRELSSALEALPQRQREAIVMRELEGRTYAEIADRMGTSRGAVRQLLSRARAGVRRRIAGLLPWDVLLRWSVASPGAPGARIGAVADVCGAGVKLCAALVPAAALGAGAVSVPVPAPAPAPTTHVRHARPHRTSPATAVRTVTPRQTRQTPVRSGPVRSATAQSHVIHIARLQPRSAHSAPTAARAPERTQSNPAAGPAAPPAPAVQSVPAVPQQPEPQAPQRRQPAEQQTPEQPAAGPAGTPASGGAHYGWLSTDQRGARP